MRPEDKPHYLAIAAYHQNLALPYRYIVSDLDNRMDKENCRAILAFGVLVVGYAFATPHPPGSVLFAGLCSSTGVPEWLRILRGGHKISNVARRWSVEGYMPREMPEQVDFSLNLDDPHFSLLEKRVGSLSTMTMEEYDEVVVYQDTLSLLRRCFAIPHQPQASFGYKSVTFLCVQMVSDKYIELLEDLRPVALVLLRFLCVLLEGWVFQLLVYQRGC
jgi:hypothetical protein